MPKPYDTRLIMIVGQLPFEIQTNQFCKLVPLVYVDGTRATAKDFPNEGEIWWMLTAQTSLLAHPGQLVVGRIEDAVGYDEQDTTSSYYQVVRDSIGPLSMKDGLEILDIPSDAIERIEDIVSGEFRHEILVRPTKVVMLRWRSKIYGPFTVSVDERTTGTAKISFSPTSTDMNVYAFDDRDVQSIPTDCRIELSVEVSLSSHRRSLSHEAATVSHHLLLGAGYDKLLAKHPPRLLLEPLDRQLIRFAKKVFVKKKRQELQRLLEELGVTARETDESETLVETLKKIKQLNERQDTALDDVTRALLQSGLLGDDRIRKAEEGFGQRYVEERKAILQSQIEASVVSARDELRKIEATLGDVRSYLQEEEDRRRKELTEELDLIRKKELESIAKEHDDFDRQKLELRRQQNLLQKNLQQVTNDLRNAGDEVVNRFLTIAPLLGISGLGERKTDSPAGSTLAKDQTSEHPVEFELPAFVSESHSAGGQTLSEEAFFDRFSKIVDDSGFAYRDVDLKAFHLSAKCGVLTVLGGPSGTGKSTLPMLYSRALLGEKADKGRPDCLMVNVNPSWMEVRDLVGHMNTLEGRFYPAESGLFQYLIYAQEEYKSRSLATGIYVACLDEMNLSQVEHYFSDFMMVLERTEERRVLECFSSASSIASCQFRKWATVSLSPALRFIGTVNFDETTRLLSDRFLDRTNLIRLSSDTLPPAAATKVGSNLAKAAGPMVTLRDYDSWLTEEGMPTNLASLIDEQRTIVRQIGYPISPRVYRSICRFVVSAPPLLTHEKAFDLQLAQRIIPKMRNLVTKRQLDAFDELLRLLRGSTVCTFDESIPLLEEIRDSAGERDWIVEV